MMDLGLVTHKNVCQVLPKPAAVKHHKITADVNISYIFRAGYVSRAGMFKHTFIVTYHIISYKFFLKSK